MLFSNNRFTAVTPYNYIALRHRCDHNIRHTVAVVYELATVHQGCPVSDAVQHGYLQHCQAQCLVAAKLLVFVIVMHWQVLTVPALPDVYMMSMQATVGADLLAVVM